MSQVECGSLKKVAVNDDGVEFIGQVKLGQRLNGSLSLQKIERTRGDDAPEYRVFYKPRGGDVMQMGNAWRKKTTRGDEFLTLTLDDPDWVSSLNLAVWSPTGSEDSWRVVWSRPRAAQPNASAA